MADKCESVIRDPSPWTSYDHPCGRPAKGTLANGDPACDVHLRSERIEAENRAKRDDWQERTAKVGAALGISVQGWDGPDRPVSCDLAELEALADAVTKGDEVAS